MATFYEEIAPGHTVTCYACKGPIREAVFYHQCDVRITGDRRARNYCFSCMASREICRRCKESYTKMFCPLSLRANDEILRQLHESKNQKIPLVERPTFETAKPKQVEMPLELKDPITKFQKARAEFYCLLAEYSSMV